MRLKVEIGRLGDAGRAASHRVDQAIERTVGFFRRTFRLGDSYSQDDVQWPTSGPGKSPESERHDSGDRSAGGYWIGELEADSTLESDYILLLYFLDKDKYNEKIRKLAKQILKQQLVDGSWNNCLGSEGDVSASVKAYFALKLAGHSIETPYMVKAREAILRMGGAERVNSYTKISFSFLNQFDYQEVPAVPPEIILFPKFFYFNIYEMSYWSRAILIPLSIVYAKKPNRDQAPDIGIEEIFANRIGAANDNGLGDSNGPGSNDSRTSAGYTDSGKTTGSHENGGANTNNGNRTEESAAVARPNGTQNGGRVTGRLSNLRMVLPEISRDAQLLSWRNFFVVVDRILRLIEKTPIKPFRSIALKKAENWVVSRSLDSDGLGAIFPSMVNSVMAMRCLGYDESHPCLASNLEKIQELEIEEGDTIRLQPCLSPVWDTALVMNALAEAGCPSDMPELVGGARWLLSKEVRKPGDWKFRVRNAPVSGWPFQFRNEFYPDIDDTAAVLLALDRVEENDVEGVTECINRALEWIVSMQCSNGGWAAFDADIDHQILTHVPYADHNAMLDPACADITGRVLEALSRFPELHSRPDYKRAIQRGIEYLKEAQESDGSWYGRWGVNYVYGTWQSLKGLIAAGEDANSPHIRRAVDWLNNCQNEDGGWGERCESYEDHSLKGKGNSTASQTSWAVMGLIAAGELDSDAVRCGVKHLLETQKEDGTWDEDEWTGTGFPGVFYLRYHFYRVTFPLFALAYYRNVVDGASPHDTKSVELTVGRTSFGDRPVKGLREDVFGNGTDGR